MSKLSPTARRLRVCYAKDCRLAYLGHLEVMNTIMRAVRRSGVPFEVGNGFARRMRIQFSQALPVGASSRGEYYDLKIPVPIDAEQALADLRAASPRALAPNAALVFPRRLPALEAWANLSCWEVQVRKEGLSADVFRDELARLREQGYIDFMRGPKQRHLELGDTLASCEVSAAEGGVDLVLKTRSTEGGSLRPAVLVQAVAGCAPLRVCRVGQWHECEDGRLLDPMDPDALNL